MELEIIILYTEVIKKLYKIKNIEGIYKIYKAYIYCCIYRMYKWVYIFVYIRISF